MRVSSINNNYYYNRYYINNNRAVNETNPYDCLAFKSKPLKNQLQWDFKALFNKSKLLLGIVFIVLTKGISYFTEYKNSYNELVGYVKPEQTVFDSKEEAFNYAINKIVGPLNSSKPYEYAVVMDHKTHEVLSENKGDASSVLPHNFDFLLRERMKIKRPYITLHGHPEGEFMRERLATTTFSFQDFKAFNNAENEKEMYVVNKDGKYCILRKKDNYKKISKEEIDKLKEDYSFAFRSAWANEIKVNKDNKVIHSFFDQQGMHAFWKRVADNYNCEYYTTYGIHDGEDVYIDYYYPELSIPQEPSGHRNFKKLW